MSKTLFVSDLDGTLLQPDARLSSRTVEMLDKAIDSGKLFTAATARTPATVASILRDVNTTLPMIVMTGAALWDPRTGIYSRLRLFEPEAAEKLLEVYRSTRTPTFVYSLNNNMITIRHIGELTPLQREFLDERSASPFKRIDVDASGNSRFPEHLDDIILLYSMVDNSVGEHVYRITRDLPGVRAQFYHDIYGDRTAIIEAFSPEATKAKAMRALATKIGADRIVAFGDNVNDIPMMREADVAVAVGNAIDAVKEEADIVIGPNTEDAVARFIIENY